MEHALSQQLLDLFFSQALDGCFFMMLDEPVRWDNTVDKEAVLDYVFDHQRVTRVNDALLEQYQTTRERYLGLTPRDLFGFDIAAAKDLWRDLFDAGQRRMETSIRKFDGAVMWIEGNFICLYDDEGRITGHFGMQRDITQRKQMEEALRESEERYRQMFDNNYAVKLVIDPETGFILDANRAALLFYGYTLDEMRALRIWEINILSAENIRDEMTKAEEGERKMFNFRHRIANGEIRDVEVYSGPVDVQGKKVLYSIINDVTERRKIEEALRESKERYKMVVEAQTELICRYKPDLTFSFVNDAFCRCYGKSADELIGQSFLTVIPEDLHQSVREQINLLLKTPRLDSVSYERYLTTASGDSRWYSWIDRVIVDDQGDPVEIQTVGRDVTEIKEVQNALWESEQRFQSILNSLHDIVWSVSLPDLKVVYMNSVVEQVYRCRVAEFMHESWMWIARIYPDDQITFQRMRNQLLREGYADAEYRIVRPDGSVRWLHERGWIVKSVTGEDVRIDGTATDITERKLSEHHKLDLAVEKERVQMLANFVRDISHEFRTPLAIINSCLYLIEKVPEPEKRQRQTEQAKAQVSLIARLLDTLLTMSKLDSGLTFNFYKTDLNELIRMLSVRLQPTLREKQLSFYLDLAPDLPEVQVDRGQLTLALGNLIDNAVRYTPAEGTLTLRTVMKAGDVAIEVIDTGVGIQPDILPHIFKRFWRQDQAHTTPGFGLGLPIVQKIVERHAGRMEVESTPGQGTTFRIRLPVETVGVS